MAVRVHGARRVRRATAFVGALAMLLAAAACGGSTTKPDTTTTSSSTTTASSTTTSAATTTSVPAFTGTISVQGTPCNAPSSGNVSCTFVGNATGGQTPYTFAWRFTNPANQQVVTVNGQQVSPALGCTYSTGVTTFNVSIQLTITPASGSAITVTGTQQVGRPSGNCGV